MGFGGMRDLRLLTNQMNDQLLCVRDLIIFTPSLWPVNGGFVSHSASALYSQYLSSTEVPPNLVAFEFGKSNLN